MSARTTFATRFFERFLAHRLHWAVVIIAATQLLCAFGILVKPDFSVEFLFPEQSQAKTDYDRYKSIYPYEDARALVMVEAKDLYTPAGLARVGALERDLAAITISALAKEHEGGFCTAERGAPIRYWPSLRCRLAELSGGHARAPVAAVVDVEGPLSIRDVVDAGEETVKLEKLFPRADLAPAEIERRKATATSDPLFRWQLTPPDASSATIRVTLAKEVARRDDMRNLFLEGLRAVVAAHSTPAQRVVISGMPVIRSEYTELIAKDKNVTGALALTVILVLLYVTFRSAKETAAALVTIVASIAWTRGGMGIILYPEQILTGILPTVVMIISISDTVHILSHYKDSLAAGKPHREALVHAMADSAWPCFLTEVTIAAGFLALYQVNIQLISQFGIATAIGMILTWVANMTVLPLMIDVLRPKPSESGRTAAEAGFARFIGWVARTVQERPRRVVAAASVILALGAVGATRIGLEYFAFDDLRPTSAIKKEIEYAERTFGGCDPLVIFIEPAKGAPAEEPMLEPEALRSMDRIAQTLESTFPREVKNAYSLADYVKKAHRILAGPEEAAKDPLPRSRSLVAQEVLFVDDGKVLRDYLDFSRRTAAVFVNMPDVGTTRLEQILRQLRPLLDEEERRLAAAGVPAKITATGMFAIGGDIYATLVHGLLASLAGAIGVSFLVFCIVLRSWRLGLLALVPNVVPLVLTFAFMGVSGIQLTPTTVIVFSITLVIADDDTVQFFSRFRQRYVELCEEGDADPHRTAVVSTLQESGLPMFITACAVSVGFLTLLVSQFLGLAYFGVLVGVSLFTAIFADLFLTPVLILRFRPRIGGVKAPAKGAASPALEGSAPAGTV